MNKFKVGDPVKIRKGITNEDMGTNYPLLDLDKVYHISAVEGTWYHLKETHPGYCFCTDWLEPAPVTPPVDEPKGKAKAKYKVGDLVVFDMDAYIKDVGTKSSWADDVPTTLMTVTAIDGHTHKVAETKYVFHDKWLRPAKVEGKDAPEEESKTGYEVGDSVIILKDAIREFQKSLNLPGGEWIDMLPNGPVKIESMPRRNEIHVEGFPYIFLHPDWIRHADKLEVRVKPFGIERVLFNEPATIVFWTDGTKTVVKCRKGDEWDAEKGLAMACAKKLLGNENGYHKEIAKYAKTANKDESVLMDTEKLRNFVLKTCLSFVGCTDCPCRISNGGRCFIIATADREQLSMMYRQFLYSGKLRKEENNA